MNRQELELIGRLNDKNTQQMLEDLRGNFEKLTPEEGILVEDNRSLEEVIREVAEEEGMSYEQTLSLFKEGVRDISGVLSRNKPTTKQKIKAKKKRKMAKKSRKQNR